MVKVFSRRGFLAGAALLMAPVAYANPPTASLRPRLRPDSIKRQAAGGPEALIKAAGLSGAVSFAVADLSTGRILEEHNGGHAFAPASVTKALTALYALETLGTAHRFETRVIATGPVADGVLDGDLVLVGGGDPTLGTNALAGLAAALKKAGIRAVKGRFLVHGGALPYVKSIDPDQPDSAGYSPSVSGLCLNYNRVHFEWKRTANGYAITMDARSDRYRPDVRVARMKLATRQSPVYTYASSAGADNWTVATSALGKGGARWLPVRKPELYAGEVFRTLARSHGIVLGEAQKVSRGPGGTVVASHHSEPLVVIVRAMLKYSTNITAEMVGMAASKARGAPIKNLRDSAREMSRWASGSLKMGRANLLDHSGLGGGSRMRSGELARALAAVARHDVLSPLLKEVLLRRADGKPDKGHAIKVRAKTGTLNYVSGLAGYMHAPDGRDLAFAIFAADQPARAKIKRADRIRPKGAKSWNQRAKRLQQSLIERWGKIYGA